MHTQGLIDLHCHLLPDLDDGSASWDETLCMVRLAIDDGIHEIVATPRQLGVYRHVCATEISRRGDDLRNQLQKMGVDLTIHVGSVARVEPSVVSKVDDGEVLTVANQRRHLLLDLPNDLYLPFSSTIQQCRELGIQPILVHPERNRGLQRTPRMIESLVEDGCLMQIAAGSLLGAHGVQARGLAEWMVVEQLVQFVATEATDATSRRPLMQRAFLRTAQLSHLSFAERVCKTNPRLVLEGQAVLVPTRPKNQRFLEWLPWRKAA